MEHAELPEAYLVLTAAESGQQSVHHISTAKTVLGRGADCDVALGSPRVSRHHARLTWDGERFLLEDLGSTNGTRVNGAAASGPAPLRDGDVVELADVRFVFQANAPTVVMSIPPASSDLVVNLSAHEVRLDGEAVMLAPKEYRLIALLHSRADVVVTREEIAEEVWPELEGDVTEESIAQLVTRLRRKVEKDPANPRHVVTVRGFGYRFVSDSVP